MQCSAVQCSAVQCSAVQCSAVQCSAVQCSAVQCSAVQCSAVQCSTVQYSTVQYSTVQYSTVQYSTVQLLLRNTVKLCFRSASEYVDQLHCFPYIEPTPSDYFPKDSSDTTVRYTLNSSKRHNQANFFF